MMLSDYLKFISEVFPLSVYNYIGNIYIYMMIHIVSHWVADASPYVRHPLCYQNFKCKYLKTNYWGVWEHLKDRGGFIINL